MFVFGWGRLNPTSGSLPKIGPLAQLGRPPPPLPTQVIGIE